MAILKDLTKKDVVKPMSLLETVGAGAFGSIGNGLLTGFLGGKLPMWAIAGIEAGAGILAGNLIGGNVGNMLQSGMVIAGMTKVSDFVVGFGKNLIGGGQQTTATAQTTGNMY